MIWCNLGIVDFFVWVYLFYSGMVSNGTIIPSGIVPLARPQVSGSVTVQTTGAQSQILGSPTQVQLATSLLGSAGAMLNHQTLQAVSVCLLFSVVFLISFSHVLLCLVQGMFLLLLFRETSDGWWLSSSFGALRP